jgi:hypothetical protein
MRSRHRLEGRFIVSVRMEERCRSLERGFDCLGRQTRGGENRFGRADEGRLEEGEEVRLLAPRGRGFEGHWSWRGVNGEGWSICSRIGRETDQLEFASGRERG